MERSLLLLLEMELKSDTHKLHTTPPAFLARGRILLVDESDAFLSSLSRILREKFGDESVLVLKRISDAMELLESEPIALLVADIEAPGKDAFDIVRVIRERHPELQLIATTGYGNDFLLHMAERLGCVGYFEKPVQLKLIAECVSRTLSGTRETKAHLTGFSATDIIELYLKSGCTGVLTVEHPDGKGYLSFREGLLIHANFGAEEGPAALLHVLSLPSPSLSSFTAELLPRETLALSLFLFENLVDLEDGEERMSFLEEHKLGNSFTPVKPEPIRKEPEPPPTVVDEVLRANVLNVLPERERSSAPLAAPEESRDSSYLDAKPMSWSESRRELRSSAREQFDPRLGITEPPQVHVPVRGTSPERQVLELVNTGIECFRAHHVAEAEELWKRALRLDPNCEAAKRNLVIAQAISRSLAERTGKDL